MKTFSYLPLFLCLSAFAVENPVIYGEDDRVDLSEATEMQQELARSTAVMVPKERIKKSLFSRMASLSGARSFDEQVTDYEGIPLCKEERFRDKITGGVCSGFLIGADIMVTAGHCIMTDEQCKAHDWVFDFLPDENAKYRIPKKNIYSCEKLIAWKNDFITGLDYAIIKLSKRVSGRKPLDIRRKGKIEDNADVMVIGNPYGLATKVAAGAKVVDNEDEAFFVTDLDTLQGNSGSAVFNAKTGVVEGILVRGEDDFEYDYDRECFKSKRCADANECRGEDVIRITELPEINSGGKLHMIAQKGNAEEIHPLLERTSWIDVIDEAGASPLMVAAKNDNLEVMDMLITLGADVNHQDINGNTALHVLANLGKESSEAFQKLLDNGAKMNIKNVRGQTAKAILKSVNSSNNHR